MRIGKASGDRSPLPPEIREMLVRTSLLLLALVGATAVHAHEIGTTRVSATFHDSRTYDIEIVTDAAALAEKLAASGGDLRTRLKIVFDTGEATPQLAYSAVPGSLAPIRLTGQIPANARQFTWNYGWTFSSYALILRDDSSAA